MSTQQYTIATARVPGPKLPIVIVPGIMGSRLTDPATNDLVWNPLAIASGEEPGPFAANYARLIRTNELLVPDETHRYPHVSERVYVDPVNHFYNLIRGFYGGLALGLHYDLRNELRAAGKSVTPAVYCCGYDWRQNNAASASRLSQIVQEARADCDGQQVVIIAHSMGGLVARHFCRNLGGESEVRALFLLGSPSLGAVSAFVNMRNGLGAIDEVRIILNATATETRWLMMAMQSCYQLLPNETYCSQVNRSWATFDPGRTGMPDTTGFTPGTPSRPQFSDNSNVNDFYSDIYTGIRAAADSRRQATAQLPIALAFHRGLQVGPNVYMHPNTFCHYSDGVRTIDRADIRYNGMAPSIGNDVVVNSTVTEALGGGDKTVPTRSAFPASVSAPFVHVRNWSNVEHTELSSNANVIDAIRAELVALA